jgi:acyl carrier protein
MSEHDELALFLADLVAGVSDGQVTAAEVLSGPASFAALGVNSLAQLRLIDEVETVFDVLIDSPEDAGGLHSLAECLRRQGVAGPP